MEVCVNGTRDSSTFTSKAEAKVWAQRREAELLLSPEQRAAAMTVSELLHRYAVEESPKKRGARWEQLRLALIGRMDLGRVPLARLDSTALAQWRDQRSRQVSAGSVLREMNLLRHVFTVAWQEWKVLPANPMAGVRRPASPHARVRRPTEDEIARLCLAAGYSLDGDVPLVKQRVALAMLLAIETAMRAGELCGIEPKHVDFGARTVHLPMTKNGTARDVPLSQGAMRLLTQLQPWGATVLQVEAASLSVLFARLCKICRIEDLHFHDMRREATSRMAKKLDVLELARVTGHKDLKSLMVYYQASASELAQRL